MIARAVSILTVASCALYAAASPAWAQSAPGWSRGQQALNLAYNVCVARMAPSLQAEGYRIDANQGNFAVGIKGYHTAVIICSPAAQGQLVQIVVASNGEGGGVERQRLQARMAGTAPPTTQTGGTPQRGNWTIAFIGCGGYLDPQAGAQLAQAANGTLSGTLYGRFDRAQTAEVLGTSLIAGSQLNLNFHPAGWASEIDLTGTWDGAKFAGKLHHYTSDDCSFAMYPNR